MENIKIAGTIEMWSNAIEGEKEFIKHISKNIINTAKKSITEAELFGEQLTSVHEIARSFLNKHKKTINPREFPSMDIIEAKIKELYDNTLEHHDHPQTKKLRKFFLRLSITNPCKLFSIGTWTRNGLRYRHDTLCWVGAYKVFGARWKHSNTFFVDPLGEKIGKTESGTVPKKGETEVDNSRNLKNIESTITKKDVIMIENSSKDIGEKRCGEAETKEDESPKKQKSKEDKGDNTPKPGLYIKRDRKKMKTVQFTKNPRQHTSYLKLKTRRIKSEELSDQGKELVNILNELARRMWRIDESIVIHKWNESAMQYLSCINRHTKLPEERIVWDAFISNSFTRVNESTWIRLKIGHNSKLDHILNSQHILELESKDEKLSRDKIQDKYVVKAGFLLGSTPGCHNSNCLEEALKTYPLLYNKDVECRVEFIRLKKGRLDKEERENTTRAVHIHCAYKEAANIRKAMNHIYGSNNKWGYPLGKKMVFVPHMFDKRFPITKAASIRYKKAVAQQKAFMETVEIESFQGIIGLDYSNKASDNRTLRQIVMSTISEKDNCRLFLGVEESFGFNVNFAYRKKDYEQVSEFLEALPLIMEYTYGTRAWEWFDNESKSRLQDYKWDPTTGLTSLGEEEYEKAMLEFAAIENLEDTYVFEEDEKSTNLSFSFDFSNITAQHESDIEVKTVGGTVITFGSEAKKDTDSSSYDNASFTDMVQDPNKIDEEALQKMMQNMEFANRIKAMLESNKNSKIGKKPPEDKEEPVGGGDS